MPEQQKEISVALLQQQIVRILCSVKRSIRGREKTIGQLSGLEGTVSVLQQGGQALHRGVGWLGRQIRSKKSKTMFHRSISALDQELIDECSYDAVSKIF